MRVMTEIKTILITGASSGFGKATAKLLAKEGHKLILVARRKELLKQLQKELSSNTYTATVDVRDKNQIEDLFKNLPEEFRDIDVLINSAGLALGLEPATEADIENWEIMVDTNIKGLMYFTRFALDIMKKRKNGLIVNISSISATVPYKGSNVYGATKAFVNQFSRNLQTDLLGTNIKVSNIEPGTAETEFSMVRFKGNKEKATKVYQETKFLTPEDIAKTILWVINQPAHVNIGAIEVWPTNETFGGYAVNKNQK